MLPPVLLLLVLLCGLGLFGSSWVEGIASDIARARADATARSLSASAELAQALHRDQLDRVDRLLSRTLEDDPFLAYVVLRTPARVFTGMRGDNEGVVLGKNLPLLTQIHEALHGTAVRTIGGIPLVVTRQALPRLFYAGVMQGAPAGPAPGGTTPGTPAAPEFIIDHARSQGELFVGVSLQRQGAEHRSNLWSLLTFLGVGALCYALAMLYLLGGFTRRMELLAQGARRIEEGDFSARLGSAGSAGSGAATDDLGAVGRAFDVATERLSQAMNTMHGTSSVLLRTAREVGETAEKLRRGAGTQVSDADGAMQSVREVIGSLNNAVKQGETVRDETRLSASISTHLAQVSLQSSASAEEMDRVVTTTVDNVRQINASSADVAARAARLSETTASTAGAMVDLKQSIGKVRETALAAAELAEQAGLDAERGTLVLAESLAGIEHIRDASLAIGNVTDNLQRRVSEIGDVLHLITELTQRTNLLALNASIIAAQAGAEGRGFAVVADEIKDLARRTANSAGSIDNLIQAVAEGAHAARRAALTGGEAVESGLSQAKEAGRTMTDILSRLRTWSAMAKQIAHSTDDQARGSSQVSRSIQEVQQGVADIAVKSAEQARRSEYLQRQSARLQEVVELISIAAQEQREGTAQVADTLGRLTHTVEEMSGDQRSRVADGERVRGLLEVLRRIATGHRDAAAGLERAVTELKTQAAVLDDELIRIKR